MIPAHVAVTRDGSDHRRKGMLGEPEGEPQHERDGEITDACKGRLRPTVTDRVQLRQCYNHTG